MKKKTVAAIIMVLMIITMLSRVLAGDAVRVTALKGPTAMGLVKMMTDEPQEYAFAIEGSIDAITPKLVKGETDIAAVPANLAAVLYQKTGGAVRVVAVNTLGVLYIVESGDTVHSIAELRGKSIFASGKGATPEYALRYLLSENGIDPDQDVKIEWKSEHSECLSALLANEGAAALLPQPFVTSALLSGKNIRVAIDLNEAWEEASTNGDDTGLLITGVMVARTEFIRQYPEKVNAFLDRYARSVDYVNQNTAEAAALIAQYEIVPQAVAELALPYCSIVCVEGEDMKTALQAYLRVLYEQNPAAVGGALPKDDFYYER